MEKEDLIGTGIVFTIVAIVLTPFISLIWSTANDSTIPINTYSKTVEAEIQGIDQHMRGSGSMNGSGSFLGWSQEGSAKIGDQMGRLSITVDIAETTQYIDLKLNRSRYMHFVENMDGTIPLQLQVFGCKVDGDIKLCYRMHYTDNKQMIETYGDFESNLVKLKTDRNAITDNPPGYWGFCCNRKQANGYLPESVSRQIILREREKLYQ